MIQISSMAHPGKQSLASQEMLFEDLVPPPPAMFSFNEHLSDTALPPGLWDRYLLLASCESGPSFPGLKIQIIVVPLSWLVGRIK